MKLTIMRMTRILILALLPFALHAQQENDYAIRLHAGTFIPDENSRDLTAHDEVMQSSLFGNTYYLTIQFYDLPSDAAKGQLASAGIKLIDYIPNRAFTAAVHASANLSSLSRLGIRSVFRFSAAQKAPAAVLEGIIPSHAAPAEGYADLSVLTYEKMEDAVFSNALNSLEASVLESLPLFRNFIVRVPASRLGELAALPFVQWVEFIDPPNEAENLLGRTLHRVNVLNDGVRNLKGDGVNIGIWDGNEVSPHLDFSPAGRVSIMEPTGTASSHSTHCAGTLTGRGLIDHRARGMAPNARLFSYNYSGSIATEMANGIPANNLSVSSHSYGGSVSTCSITGSQIAYTTTSRNTDLNLNNFPYHLHVHSSGNSQASCPGGWYTITGSGKTAKNNILVANITTTEALSGSSSCGPTGDGRIKPEISAFGTSVLSTYTPLNTYGTISGTSMATPGVAGSVVLLVQRYRQLTGGLEPPSSLIKNTVCNTAADLGNPGPDYRFGFGRINALKAVRILEENRYALNTMSQGNSTDVQITVPAGASRLSVMLTWNDPAGASNANPALVNNLDLLVLDGAATAFQPWILNPNSPGSIATRGVDNVGNIEQVTIDNPPAGIYTLRVTGTAIPVGPQQYALTWDIDQPCIEVTYPNGNESMNPGSSETITWDHSGVNAQQTVEYSLDGGANWTTISSTVPAGSKRLGWAVPAANTSTALVRVSSGALSDVSDATFRILGTVTGFTTNASSCTAGEISFNWNAVSNATHYDILTLDPSSGEWVVLVADIPGTTYTATGLVPNASMWFTILAKNNTTGSMSVRALAINRTVSAGGVSSIGSITGPSTICGTPGGIAYSVAPVSGATSYTWAVPPGAVISSGQSTSSILVDFPAGSSNGNVSVYASAGTCQTNTATMAVTVGGAAVAAPVSDGDQAVIHCDPNPIPTLTASVTVPAGHTIVWYDAPAAGDVVASPTLNTIGSVTYYASSINDNTGCESASRTAVTLTISTAPAAAITASGPLSFCEGGEVVLTASAGASYLWNNGATSPSITVSASGTYSVVVTQTGGCSSSAGPVNVQVNPNPASVITADGPLDFCEGNSVMLTASPGSTYAWSNGATTQSISVSQSGNYSVMVTDANGCSTPSAATAVSVSPSPVVTLTVVPYTRLYPGLSTVLMANVSPAGSYTFEWTRNGNPVAGAPGASLLVNVDLLGDYAVRVENAAGCANVSAVQTIADSASTKLFIWPNPNTGVFQVSYHRGAGLGSVNYTLTIYDAKGAYVFRQSYSINSPYQLMEVNMTREAGGVYMVVLTDNGGKRLASAPVVIQ